MPAPHQTEAAMEAQATQESTTKRSSKEKGDNLDASVSQWRDAFKRRLGDREGDRLRLPLV